MGAGEAAHLADVITNCVNFWIYTGKGEGEHPTVTKPSWVAAGAFGDPLKPERKGFQSKKVFLVITGNVLQA